MLTILSLNIIKSRINNYINCTSLSKNFIKFYSSKTSYDGYYFFEPYSNDLKTKFLNNCLIYLDFINDIEEKSILDEVHPRLRRMHYQFDHWDNAIQGFKEFEKDNWNETNEKVIDKIRKYAFKLDQYYLPEVHVIDLAEQGHIKPHIDSVRFCGDTIAGVSLLTDSIMRFISEKYNMKVDVLLKRRSLYIMKDFVRYEFTHEVLGNDHSSFNGEKIHKGRRISVLCRSKPDANLEEDNKIK